MYEALMVDKSFDELVEEGLARAPKFQTPEWGEWLEEQKEAAWREGLRKFTTDEMLVALERERAGYDGLGELWGCTPISTQA
jgi:hypothetical protein